MTTPPPDTPCTGEPAVPAIAHVVEVLLEDRGNTYLKVRAQSVATIDFYAKPTNPERLNVL